MSIKEPLEQVRTRHRLPACFQMPDLNSVNRSQLASTILSLKQLQTKIELDPSHCLTQIG